MVEEVKIYISFNIANSCGGVVTLVMTVMKQIITTMHMHLQKCSKFTPRPIMRKIIPTQIMLKTDSLLGKPKQFVLRKFYFKLQVCLRIWNCRPKIYPRTKQSLVILIILGNGIYFPSDPYIKMISVGQKKGKFSSLWVFSCADMGC